MKRLFGKSSKTELKDSSDLKDDSDDEETEHKAEVNTPKKTHRKRSTEPESERVDIGQGDAEKKERGRVSRHGTTKEIEEKRSFGTRRKLKPVTNTAEHNAESDEDDNVVEDDETVTKPTKPKPFPRRRRESKSLFVTDSEDGRNEVREETTKENIQPSSLLKTRAGKDTKSKKKQRTRGNDNNEESSTEAEEFQFVSIKESQNLPKLETYKRGHYFSSIYNYKRPISSFKFRARVLKYPAFTEQQQWKGEMAVIDERTFQWQEKVFSKMEAKRYQKLDNCLTDQERKYNEDLARSTKSIGKYLHSYVTDDLYVTKKKMRLLTKRCPVPHSRKENSFSRLALDTSVRSLASDCDSLDLEAGAEGDFESDDSIDFDDPISSSTPVQQRKAKDKGAAEEVAKAEKKMREKREKELKELEKKNVKLKDEMMKKEKDNEKRKQQEETKIVEKRKKLEDMKAKEKELRFAYMTKYKYPKRPSVPLGARMRSVRLTPSPMKLERRKKSQTISRSSEISDFQDDEMGSVPSLDSKDDIVPKGGQRGSKGEIEKLHTESLKFSQKMVHSESKEHGDSAGEFSTGVVGSKNGMKINDRALYRNTQTMYIMASIPYMSGRYREVVVCMIHNIPSQNVLVFKPSLGYRNLEAKRNNLFRISCEILPFDERTQSKVPSIKKQSRRYQTTADKPNIYGDLGFFETVPKNEFRLSVLAEITTAHGFDATPLCIYYAVDIPKGWRNDSLHSNTEGMTHTCFTNHKGIAQFSHVFSFQLVFSMDFIDEPTRSYPTPVIALMAVSMNHPSPRIVYDGYGYVNVPMAPGSHIIEVRTWKPKPRSVVEKMRATFLDISPSLQDIKLAHIGSTDTDETGKANLIGLQTEPSGTIKLRLHVIHQTPVSNREYESSLDLLEKMSSATILKSVQSVIQAFQRAREKAEDLKSKYD